MSRRALVASVVLVTLLVSVPALAQSQSALYTFEGTGDVRAWDVRTGPFVTVSCCSGTAALGTAMAERFPGALCEGMEGAALAHVAAIYQVPLLELRAVSNLVEDRDMSRWRIREAAETAQQAVRIVVRAWD